MDSSVFLSVAAGFGVWAVLAAAVSAGLWAWRARIQFAKAVVVNLHDGTGLRGTLVKRSATLLVLEKVQMVGEETEPISIDGTVYVERRNVHFIQGY